MPRERPQPVSLCGLIPAQAASEGVTSNTAYQLESCELRRNRHPALRMWCITRVKPLRTESKRQRAALITKVTTVLPTLHGSQKGLLRAAMSGQNVGRFDAHFSQYFRNRNQIVDDIASPNCLT
jgi:hypothetical protein